MKGIFLVPLLFVAVHGGSRVVITFEEPSAAVNMSGLPWDVQVIKQYGRRLVVDMGREVLEGDLAECLGLWTSAVDAELDVPVVVTESLSVVSSDISVVSSDNQLLTVSMKNKSAEWQWNLFGEWGIGLDATNHTGEGTIAILDSGFNGAGGWDFVSDLLLSGDGDGRDSNATDPGNTACGTWHGTKMASIIRGAESIIKGGEPLMRGVAPNANLLSIRVLGKCQEGLASDVADGIVWAVGGQINGLEVNPSPANIVSMSFVGPGGCPSYLQSAITLARGMGVVLVAAAGNSADNVSNWFPANCEGVISVGASTIDGTLASWGFRTLINSH